MPHTTVDPLPRYKDFQLSEAYDVVRTVEVVKDGERYRLDVLMSMSSPNTYDVQCYRWTIQQQTVETTDTVSGVWLLLRDFPSSLERNEELALQTALSVVPGSSLRKVRSS